LLELREDLKKKGKNPVEIEKKVQRTFIIINGLPAIHRVLLTTKKQKNPLDEFID
jgi:hypothetical protein